MRTAGLASILLLASGTVFGLPQGGSISGDFWWQQGGASKDSTTDGSKVSTTEASVTVRSAASGGGSISGAFWWQQGGAIGGNSGSDATDAPSNIFNQDVNASNSPVSQVTSQVTSGNSVTPTQSEFCALGQGCVPWQLCPLGVITQGSYVEPGKVPYPANAGYTGCSDVNGNVCCGIPADVLSQQQQGQNNAPDNSPSSSQQNQGSSLNDAHAQCASNQDCVPHFQCYNGELNTDGGGLLGIRTKPKATCSHPDYPDVPAICCRVPGRPDPIVVTPATIRESQCDGYKVCVSKGICDDNGNVNTDGGGLLDLRIIHKSCNVDGTSEIGVCCTPPGAPTETTPRPIPKLDVCPSQSSCIDPSLCKGRAIDSTNNWTSYSPTGTIFSKCTVGSGSYTGEGVCCINPVIAEVCPHNDECVPQNQCDQNGNIITDGSGSIDIRRKTTACYVDDAKYDTGVCCKPPQPPQPVRNAVDICPGQSVCVPELFCTGKALDNGGSLVNYVSGGIWSTCNLAGDSSTPGICCENPPDIKPCSSSQVCVDSNQCGKDGNVVTDGSGIFDLRLKPQVCYTDEASYTKGVCCTPPPPSLPLVEICPGTSTCVPDFLCTGQVLDSTGSMIAYSPQGSWSQCTIGFSGTVMGVCCVNPPPLPPTKPIDEPFPQCGHRNKEEVLDTRIQSVVATNEAQFGEFPWQAIIFFTNYTFKCGASLIGDRWLVTGGHCVNGLEPSEIQIRLGEWQVNSFDEPLGYVDVQVKGITVHPDFNIKNVQNNVAVLELAEPVEIQYHINSICLPAPGQTFRNQRCIISGWGKDSFEGNYQHIIKKVDVPTVGKKKCQALLRKTRLGRWFTLHNSFMCAGGEENKDACKGDGGGPLACEDPATGRYYLAGLTSWGIGCGNKDVPGVYADVQGFSTWIQGVIGGDLVQQQQVIGPEVEAGSNPYGK